MEALTNILETRSKGRWQWKSNPNPWSQTEEPHWESYSLEQNYLIEKAYYDRRDEIDIGDDVVSITNMIQKNSQRPIRRINCPEEIDRSERYIYTELPKTINKIFGSLGDFISFFSRRNQEILDFASHFKELEQSNDLNVLIQKIIPKLISCLEEILLKPNLEQQKNSDTLSQLKKKLILEMNSEILTLISLFKKEFLSIEEFYGHILKAYTMNTDLYPILNNSLRNENWVEVDRLLPYAFCFCKAFFNLRLKTNCAQDKETPSSMLLYRGTAFDETSLSFYNREKWHYFSWNSVTSTSKDNRVAEHFMYPNADLANKKYPVMFVIEVPLATEFEPEYLKWLDIRQYSAIPREDEVVLAPGSVFELQETSTDQNKITTIKIKLKSEIKSLAHGGMMMQGALQSQMMTEKEAKVMCLEGEELSQALVSLCGNKLVEELEFCLCEFSKKSLSRIFEILPTLEKVKKLKFISCLYQDNGVMKIERSQRETSGIIKIEVIEANDFFQIICNERRGQEYWISLRELDLDLKYRGSLTDKELNCVFSQGLKYLPRLASLSVKFEECRQITNEGMNNFIKGLNYLHQLTSLNLNFEGCKQITDEELHSLAKGLSSLTQLTNLNIKIDVDYVENKITETGIHILINPFT